MPSNSRPSVTPDSSPTKDDISESSKAKEVCSICNWLTMLQDGTQKEMLRHLTKFHPPKR